MVAVQLSLFSVGRFYALYSGVGAIWLIVDNSSDRVHCPNAHPSYMGLNVYALEILGGRVAAERRAAVLNDWHAKRSFI